MQEQPIGQRQVQREQRDLQRPTGTDAGGRSLAGSLHELAVAMAAVDTVIGRALGMNSTDYLAMKHLLAGGAPLGPADLARLLGMSSGSTTALVDRLERAGHVERRPHPGDRRRLVLVPSAASVAAITDALQPLARRLDALQHELGADADVVARALDRVSDLHRRFRHDA